VALQVEDPFPDSLNLLLQGADGLKLSFGFGSQVIGRIAGFVLPFGFPVVQFGQAGVEARGQGVQFDQGGISTRD